MRIIEAAEIGERAYAPPAVLASPPCPTLEEARKEAGMVMFGAVDELFEKCEGLSPQDIGILVVNCCAFNPSPSLADMIVNRYKMREGMGCSAWIISLDLVRTLLSLQRLKDSYAMVVSTEILTLNFYKGSNRSMLLPNCLFRVGGAAILLSNTRAKYQLSHIVSINIGSDDMAYRSNFLDEDEAGNPGVVLSRHTKKAASHAMKQNIVHPLQAIFKEEAGIKALHTGFSIGFRAFVCSCRS
jgi:3-ketoacyl-CoA synthase